MSERCPNDILMEFVFGLPEKVRSELLHGVAIYLGGWVEPDHPGIPDIARALIKPLRWERLFKNAVLVAGLIDHIMNTLPSSDLREELFNVSSLQRAQWNAARLKWLALRADELSPTAIDDLDRYRGHGA